MPPALLAALPLLVVLFAMGALHRSAVVAGLLGLAAAIALLPLGFDLAGTMRPGAAAAGTAAEAAHSTLTILWILLPALAIHAVQDATGAIGRIRDTLAGLTEDRRLQAILIAWFFGLFIEGAAGFGTPVALAAPLLAGLGYPPVRAVALALLGHAAGVSFGAVGTPTLVQIELTGLSPTALAGAVASLHALLGLMLLLATVRLADDGPLRRQDIVWSALAAVLFLGPSTALAWLTGPELPSLGGAFIGLIAFIAILRVRGPETGAGISIRDLLPDIAPYLAILALILATRLIAPVQEALRTVRLEWSFADRFSGSMEPLYHPGTLLMLGLVLGTLAAGRAGAVPAALGAALRRLVPVALALLAMLALSRLMVHSGMIGALADAAAATGAAWPVAAPFLGIAGTFVTGSATASNILFTELQVSAALSLGLSPVLLAAAQSLGSAAGNLVAPHNIIAGSATVGITGREGEVMSHTLIPCALYALSAGCLVFLAAQLF